MGVEGVGRSAFNIGVYSVSLENKSHFERFRWPPVWYLKEEDRYLRCKKEREKEEELIRKQHSKNKWCFWRPPSSSSSSSIS